MALVRVTPDHVREQVRDGCGVDVGVWLRDWLMVEEDEGSREAECVRVGEGLAVLVTVRLGTGVVETVTLALSVPGHEVRQIADGGYDGQLHRPGAKTTRIVRKSRTLLLWPEWRQ